MGYEDERALLRIILSPQALLKFSYVCQGQETLFGHPNSKLQRKVQNRRRVLLRLQEEDPRAFLKLTLGFGLVASDSPARLQSEGVETDSPSTPEAVFPDRSSSSRLWQLQLSPTQEEQEPQPPSIRKNQEIPRGPIGRNRTPTPAMATSSHARRLLDANDFGT